MAYLLFNNNIYFSDGLKVKKLIKGPSLKQDLESIDVAHICVVDVDVLIAASVEYPVEKKDSILVRKFTALYEHEPYIIQDERIDNNLFQIIGIKEQKVREIYSLIPPDKVRTFIPYGIALRQALMNKKVDLNKTVVFVDDLGTERLLTVFEGLKFSRTRELVNNGQEILPEIKRSQIDFYKKTEGYSNKNSADFVIIVNSQELVAEILKDPQKPHLEFLDITCPALEGLKAIDTLIKYKLPEEEIKKRKEIEAKKKAMTSMVSFCMVAAGFIFFVMNKCELGIVRGQCESAQQTKARLEGEITILDRQTYREDLRAHKTLNYGVVYLSLLKMIPETYSMDTFRFYRTNRWNMELTLFPDDKGIFASIPRSKRLKGAQIKDIFVNDQPGKEVSIIL